MKAAIERKRSRFELTDVRICEKPLASFFGACFSSKSSYQGHLGGASMFIGGRGGREAKTT
jgi:hypothetical protein